MNPGPPGPHHGPPGPPGQGPPPNHGLPTQPHPPTGGPPQPQQRPPQARPEDAGRLAKSRDMIPVLHEKWNEAIRGGAAALTMSSNNDRHETQNKFETNVEDFFSTLDQIELNLKCAAETTGQSQASSKYMLGNLTYHQHISAAKHQVAFTKQIRDMLRTSAQDIVDNKVLVQPQQPQGPPQQQQQQQQQS